MGSDRLPKVVITGANGFIGRRLCVVLKEKGYFVRGVVRNNVRNIPGVEEYFKVEDICESTSWKHVFAGVDTVIHLAAHVCNINYQANELAETVHKTNVLGTERLARMAAEGGVKRFIFTSSVKVNGEGSLRAYTENDIPAPQSIYGNSKWSAEKSLASVGTEASLEIVILRLPLVYGPRDKGTFNDLIKIIGIGLPLPFKNINNRRSFLYIDNLVDAIATCIVHPLAADETFMVSDDKDIATPDLIKIIAETISKKPFLFYLHPYILKMLCKIFGNAENFNRLTGSLFVDSSKIRNLLGWKPPFTLEEGIKETLKYYGSDKNS